MFQLSGFYCRALGCSESHGRFKFSHPTQTTKARPRTPNMTTEQGPYTRLHLGLAWGHQRMEDMRSAAGLAAAHIDLQSTFNMLCGSGHVYMPA